MQQRLKSVALENVRIHDVFWDKYIDLVEDVILPFQWELINDRVEGAEKSYCIQNFRIVNEKRKEPHMGMVFQDTDIAQKEKDGELVCIT